MISFNPLPQKPAPSFHAKGRVIPFKSPVDTVSFSGGKPLRIGLLSYDKPETSIELNRLHRAAVARGYQVEVINPAQCFLFFDENGASVRWPGQHQGKLDAVIPDADSYGPDPNQHYYFMAVLKQFQAMGIYTLNEADPICNASDKLETHRILAEAGIPSVKTLFTFHPTPEQLDLLSEQSDQIVIKDRLGSNGVGTLLAKTKEKALELLNTVGFQSGKAIAQEYLSESKGVSYRFNIVDGKVVTVFQCKAPEGSFKSNISGGGTFQAISKFPPEDAKMAIKATKALNLDQAGVDILRTRKGPIVLEVNSAPSLEWFDSETGEDEGMDIINAFYDFIERRTSNEKSKQAV